MLGRPPTSLVGIVSREDSTNYVVGKRPRITRSTLHTNVTHTPQKKKQTNKKKHEWPVLGLTLSGIEEENTFHIYYGQKCSTPGVRILLDTS